MPAQSASILVVDDEIDNCQNLSDILTALGYEVEIATNGPDAIALFRRRNFDVALLDLRMPGMDGLTLYRELKKIRAGTVAMIVTAFAGDDTAGQALDAGAWQILPKPVDVGRLIAEVDRAVGQPMLLVVDDDADLCENLWQLLRHKDYRVSVAHSEVEAIDKLMENPVRVVLLDLKLPGGDSLRLLQSIRQSHPETRIVLITAHRTDMSATIERVLNEGAEAVCFKPFERACNLFCVRGVWYVSCGRRWGGGLRTSRRSGLMPPSSL